MRGEQEYLGERRGIDVGYRVERVVGEELRAKYNYIYIKIKPGQTVSP